MAPPGPIGSGGDVLAFTYHRSIAPTLGALLALAIVETIVIHVVAAAFWGWRIAIVLGLLDVSLVVMLVGLLRAIRLYPVTLADGVLTMRLGQLRSIAIPVDRISGLRTHWDAAAIKRRDVANLALANWPNVVVDLSGPIRTRRGEIVAVAHKLDDPGAFAAAIGALA